MMLDGLLCFRFPQLARWTVVVVDRFDGEEHPMKAVKFRWHRNAITWINRTSAEYIVKGVTVELGIRELPAPGRA